MATVWTEPRMYRTNNTSTPRALGRKEKKIALNRFHRRCSSGRFGLQGLVTVGPIRSWIQLRDERCGLGQPTGGLCQCGFIGPHEQKTGCNGYLSVGTTILADKSESRSKISHRQNDRLPFPCLYRGHFHAKFAGE